MIGHRAARRCEVLERRRRIRMGIWVARADWKSVGAGEAKHSAEHASERRGQQRRLAEVLAAFGFRRWSLDREPERQLSAAAQHE